MFNLKSNRKSNSAMKVNGEIRENIEQRKRKIIVK
jgi:hypothetical protein